MDIGLLTAPFGKKSFREVVEWASKTGFKALEVITEHLQPKDVLPDDGKAVKKLLNDCGMRISSIAYYQPFNVGNGPKEYRPFMEKLILMAEILKADAVCTMVGFPATGKSKLQTIKEDVPTVFIPLSEKAQKHGVKIAFENWYMTNLQHLEHFKAVTEILPANVGFNFDPSHLAWQEIDYCTAVREFKDRIFHTHAKDTAIFAEKKNRLGVLESGWWQYVIPGYGVISWGEYIHALRKNGYNGVLSIEHEDSAFSAEEGFEKGLRFLSGLI